MAFRIHFRACCFSIPSSRPAGLSEKIGGISASVYLSSRLGALSMASVCLISDAVSSVAKISSTSASFSSVSIPVLQGWGSVLLPFGVPRLFRSLFALASSAFALAFGCPCSFCVVTSSIDILRSVPPVSSWVSCAGCSLLLLCGSGDSDGGCWGGSLLFVGGMLYFVMGRGGCYLRVLGLVGPGTVWVVSLVVTHHFRGVFLPWSRCELRCSC